MKRIVLTGAESTGKSTLAAALAEHYNEPLTTEYVRHYVAAVTRELTENDLDPIARGQFKTEDAVLDQANRLVLHDTNILSSILYADHYFDRTLEWVNERFLERDYTLYLLCMPDIPWVADEGQREGPKAREELHKMFKAKLDSIKLPYVEIRGSETTRFDTAVAAINDILKT